MTTAFSELEYRGVPYRRAGGTGLLLPVFAFGLWHGFGEAQGRRAQAALLTGAYDLGITHFDNANRYGPPHGFAEQVLGDVLLHELRAHRSAITISTKAGNPIAPHPYGSGASRKHLFDGIEHSLRRLRVDYVDIFYSHRHDPGTPLEETAEALADIVRQGKARYVGVSNYGPEALEQIASLLRESRVPLAVAQPKYSLLEREVEKPGGALQLADEHGFGIVPYSPLAQGLLTDRYLQGAVPSDARAGRSEFLSTEFLTDDYLERTRKLTDQARAQGLTTAQLALVWLLRQRSVTSILLGASSTEQLQQNLVAASAAELPEEVLDTLDKLYPVSRKDG